MRLYHPTPTDMRGQMVPLPEGDAGIFKSLRQMRKFVTQGRCDPRIIESARNIVFMCAAKDTLAEINTLFCFVRDRVRYVSDVLDTETISPAWYTLHVRSGDCDDKSILLASLLEAIGIQTRFIVTGYGEEREYAHVHVAACLPDGAMIELDATEPNGMGWSAPDPTVRHIERLDGDPKGFWEIITTVIFGAFA
jgi:transglutaminase-like putative cysteine protease